MPAPLRPTQLEPDLQLPDLHCPAHCDLVLDFARGRLSGAREWQAEQARRGCPTCRSWWAASLSVPEVDEGVAAAVAAFTAPPREALEPTRRTAPVPMLRLAAALTLLVGGALAWTVHQNRSEMTATVDTTAETTIFADGFEDGVKFGQLSNPTGHEKADSREPLFVAGLESGELSEWSGTKSGISGSERPGETDRTSDDVRQSSQG